MSDKKEGEVTVWIEPGEYEITGTITPTPGPPGPSLRRRGTVEFIGPHGTDSDFYDCNKPTPKGPCERPKDHAGPCGRSTFPTGGH